MVCLQEELSNVVDEAEASMSDIPIDRNPLSNESLQDALDVGIAVMKDDDSIKGEDLLNEFGSPESRG